MKVGIPVMKLHAGTLNAVIREAWIRDEGEQRNCSDSAYDPSRTAENVYLLGARRATDLIRRIENRKQEYETARRRKMRKDAVLAVAGIVKPNGNQFRLLSQTEQMRFFQDSLDILQAPDFFNGHVEGCVVQMDEGIPHIHWVATPIALDGSWSAKKVLNLRMLNKLNSLYPEKMRQRGWDVESLVKFDEEQYKSLSPEEKAAYVDRKKAEKRTHGLSSAQYKAKREADKVREAANKAARAEEEAARKRAAAAIAVAKEVTEQAFSQAEEAKKAAETAQKAQEELQHTQAALSDAKEELAAVRAAVADARDTYDKYTAAVPDTYEVVQAKAMAVLLDWIPEPAAIVIRKSLDWVIQWHRDRGRWPIRKAGAKRRWPGQSSDTDRHFERGR